MHGMTQVKTVLYLPPMTSKKDHDPVLEPYVDQLDPPYPLVLDGVGGYTDMFESDRTIPSPYERRRLRHMASDHPADRLGATPKYLVDNQEAVLLSVRLAAANVVSNSTGPSTINDFIAVMDKAVEMAGPATFGGLEFSLSAADRADKMLVQLNQFIATLASSKSKSGSFSTLVQPAQAVPAPSMSPSFESSRLDPRAHSELHRSAS